MGASYATCRHCLGGTVIGVVHVGQAISGHLFGRCLKVTTLDGQPTTLALKAGICGGGCNCRLWLPPVAAGEPGWS